MIGTRYVVPYRSSFPKLFRSLVRKYGQEIAKGDVEGVEADELRARSHPLLSSASSIFHLALLLIDIRLKLVVIWGSQQPWDSVGCSS